jgi:hypothetical protein
MHGGNVMLECSPSSTDGATAREYFRTCLIDFRNSGPGPRCIDAISLESSIRLAHAAVMSSRIDLGDRAPSSQVQGEIADEMARQFDEEKSLYRSIFLGEGTVPSSNWAQLCATVLDGLKTCFGEIPMREYLAASVRYTLRGLGFRLDPIARLRMTAWLAAQYSLATEMGAVESGKVLPRVTT